MAVYIYALLDPRTMRPRYIGKTQRLEYRLYQHMRATRRSRKGNWLADLRELGLKPLMTILEEVPPEKSWEETDGKIQYMPDCGHALAGKTADVPDLNEELRNPKHVLNSPEAVR